MSKRTCPGCGLRHDKKRCPQCYFEPFDAEEVPKVRCTQIPARRPSLPSRTMPVGGYRSPRSRRHTGHFSALRAVCAVILVVISMTAVLFVAMEDALSDFSLAVREPEPIPLPESGTTLYDSDGIRVILGWDGGEITGDIPVFLENNSSRDVYACTEGVSVNGCMVEDVFFYCEAPKNTTAMSQLWIDTAYLKTLGIDTIQDITLRLIVVDGKDYIQLNAPEDYHTLLGSGGSGEAPLVSGQLLYQSEALTLVYQGAGKDAYGEWQLRFYLQNHSGEVVDVFTSELYINGEETAQYLYQQLFPNTWAVLDREIYRDERLQLTAPEDIQSLKFDLNISRYGDTYAQETVSVSVTID